MSDTKWGADNVGLCSTCARLNTCLKRNYGDVPECSLYEEAIESKHKNDPERVVCAAIWYKDNGVVMKDMCQPKNIDYGYVVCGWRHGSIFPLTVMLNGCKSVTGKVEHVQGFLTSKNRFVDRKEAHKIFVESGGVPEFPDELYSEDLY